MNEYNPNDLTDTLVYIKNIYGVKAFARGKVTATFRDLAPNLKNEQNMLERIDRRGILEKFASIADAGEDMKNRSFLAAMMELTESEYIRPDIADKYLRVLAVVFEWNVEIRKSLVLADAQAQVPMSVDTTRAVPKKDNLPEHSEPEKKQSVKSGSADSVSLAGAGRLNIVNITDIRSVNDKIYIYLDAPAETTGFVVLYRFDRFPEKIQDAGTVRKYIPLKQYQVNGAVVLNAPEKKKYYFCIFAEFTYDNGRDYSTVSRYLFNNCPKVNITYSVSKVKRFWSRAFVVFRFDADVKNFLLPEIDIVYAVGNVPAFKSLAVKLCHIPSESVNGSFRLKVPFPKGIPKNTYVRAFFRDDSAYIEKRLLLKMKSSYKVT